MMQRTARIDGSDNEYRYTLGRQWREGGAPRLMAWIMLNPSKADSNIDDSTIKRCMYTAGHLGFDGILVANLFALRATDQIELRFSSDPIGPLNDEAIIEVAKMAEIRVAAWGAPVIPLVRERAEAVKVLLKGYRLYVAGLSKKGHPRHPLYLKQPMTPQWWRHNEA